MIVNCVYLFIAMILFFPILDENSIETKGYRYRIRLPGFSQLIGITVAIIVIIRIWFTINYVMSNLVVLTLFMSYLGYLFTQRTNKSEIDFGFGWIACSMLILVCEITYWIVTTIL